jgi:uncharacterized protein
MNIVMSGATGLIGSALSQRLRERGHLVISLVRPGSHAAQGPSINWDPAHGHIDLDALAAYDHIDACIHLAGAGIADKRWSQARKNEIVTSRVRSTETLAAALTEMSPHPSTLLSASAIGVYGNRGEEVLSEASTQGSGFLAEVCSAWEHATTVADQSPIRVVHLRTGIVLDPKGGALAKQLPLFRAGLGGKLASGKQWVSWISMEDELRAIEFLLANDVHGPVNLTAPNPVTNAEFTKTLGHVVHRPAVMSVPKFALATALGAELVDEAITASQRVEPAALLAAGFSFTHPDLDEALHAMLA